MKLPTIIGHDGFALGSAMTSLPRLCRSRSVKCYQFALPKVWSDQTKLSDSEAAIYNDPSFLPSAKRQCTACAERNGFEGLQARAPSFREPLPTLCASYTAQHLLDRSYLMQKGTFAFPKESQGQYRFFDPAHFCSLCGALDEVIMPSKLTLAFHGVGNAISVPRSILCICVSLYAISSEPVF